MGKFWVLCMPAALLFIGYHDQHFVIICKYFCRSDVRGPRKVQAVTKVGWQPDGATFVVNNLLQYDRHGDIIEAEDQKCFWIPDFLQGIPEPEVNGNEKESATRKVFRTVEKALAVEGLMPCIFLAGKCLFPWF